MRISSVAAIAGVLVPVVVMGGLLAGCASETRAPFDQGVCYSVALPDEGETAAPRFNVLARDQPQIEYCAAKLEIMRVEFLRMGGSHTEVVGSYQGQFIFLDRGGVWFGKTLEGPRFFALARTGDGRLAIPGTIQRNIDANIAPAPTAAPASTPAPAA
jgi:hypothetical protein